MLKRFNYQSICMFVLSGTCLIMPLGVQAADYTTDDSYLQGLSDEADHLEYMGQAEKELHASQKGGTKAVAVQVEHSQIAITGLSKFEEILLNEYPYTYQLYRKLTIQQKQQVYERIKVTKKLSHSQKMIIDLYKASIK